MKLTTLKEVEKLCAELQTMIQLTIDKQVNAPLVKHWRTGEMTNPHANSLNQGFIEGGRDRAAIRRKSMDLTHALAKLRQDK